MKINLINIKPEHIYLNQLFIILIIVISKFDRIKGTKISVRGCLY